MVGALLLQSFVVVHRTQELLDVIDETFTVGEAVEEERLATVGALRLALFDPCTEAVLAG